MTGTKLCLLDRDGVLNTDTGYLYQIKDVRWIPGSKEAVALLNRAGYRVVVVTNQSGVARGYFTEEDVKKLHVWMGEEIKKAGGEITSFYYCPHLPGALLQEYDRECECRKPKPGMVKRALQEQQVLPENAFLIGDNPRDVEAAKRAGVKGYLFTGGNLAEFVRRILAGQIRPAGI